jgi:hypothetical protein
MKYKIIFIVAVIAIVGIFLALGKKNAKTDTAKAISPSQGDITASVTTTPASLIQTVMPTIAPSTKITLSISSPKTGSTVTSSSLKISGKTSAGADVFVNELETKADASGNFSVTMSLDEGDNYIIVMANDAEGNVAEAELTVVYNP